MSTEFQYDVFLSHNSADKPRAAGLGVAATRQSAAHSAEKHDAPQKEDGGALPRRRYDLAIERGLEAARTLVLCLSPAALGSDWVGLERSTVLFRDPANAVCSLNGDNGEVPEYLRAVA
jgi:hypothetical protein